MRRFLLAALFTLLLVVPSGAQQLNPGGGPGLPVNLNNVSINGVLNVTTFPGSDLGAQINNAEGALPLTGTGNTHRGTLYIPNGQYTLSTTALLGPDVSLQCDKGAVISVAANIGIDQNVYDATGQDDSHGGQPAAVNFSSAGGVDNCWFDGWGAPVGAIGILTGDTGGLHYVHDKFYNFFQPNDIGLQVINKVYFTEHTFIQDLICEQASNCLSFKMACLPGGQGAPPGTIPPGGDHTPGYICQNSAMYDYIQISHCGFNYGIPSSAPGGPVTGSNGYCLGALGGVNVGRPTILIHGNMDGNAGFRQEVLYADGGPTPQPPINTNYGNALPSSISFGNVDISLEDNGPSSRSDYWAYEDTNSWTYVDGSGHTQTYTSQGSINANYGQNVQYPSTQSFPPGLQLFGDRWNGQAVNLNADPGFRYGSTYWSIPTGWTVLNNFLAYGTSSANVNHPDPHVVPFGMGLNALGVLGTGATSTAGQLGSVNFPVPASPNIPTCHYTTTPSNPASDPSVFTDCIWMCYSAWADATAVTAGQVQFSIYSGDNSHDYSFGVIGPGYVGSVLNNCSPLDSTGAAHWYVNPSTATIANGKYFVFGAPMWNIGRQLQAFTDSAAGTVGAPYIGGVTNVAGLPTGIGTKAGQNYFVNDWNGTLGACVGGSTVWGQAIFDGSAWHCH